MELLTIGDLAVSGIDVEGQEARVQQMIDDAQALAFIDAPCLRTTTDPDVIAGARAVLRGAVLRWQMVGSASYQAQALDPSGRVERANTLYRFEVETLQRLCAAGQSSSVYSISLAGS